MFEKYYTDETVKFNLYGYAPPGCETGDYLLDKPLTLGLRTVDAYKDYKAVGFNIVMSGTVATYYGEPWESSLCKKMMDIVYEAGIDKYIVGDQKFYELSRKREGLIGEGKSFANADELDAFVAERMKNYSAHPAFYGVYFADEPHYYYFKAFGELYRSIKRVCPKAFVHCNLLPLDTLRWMDERYPKGGDLFERRSKYLQLFLDETGADYIKYDDYPFCYAKENKVLYLRCLQNASAICRDRNIDLHFVAQSFSMDIGKNPYYWVPNEREMRYQLHLLLGFGVRDLGFFTYMPHGANSTENFHDDGAMVNAKGEKMPLYYTTQKLIRELYDIAPVVTKFRYQHSAYDVKSFKSFMKQLDYALNEKLDGVDAFETDSEGVLINELYDKDNGQYLYRVINLADIRNEGLEKEIQTTRICFDKRFRFADVYEKGVWVKKTLSDGGLDVALSAGEAAYVLVY